MTPGRHIDLAALEAAANPQPEQPLPWMVRNHDLIAIALVLCIAAAWALGEWRLG